MKFLNMTGLALLVPLLTLGCAREKDAEGVIPQGYQDAVKKAGSVENKLQDAAQQQLQELDQSS